MERSYKFRLYPTPEQQDLIQRTFGCCRFVYNYYLMKRKAAYKADKITMGYNDCSADMTNLKKELVWLKEVDCTALQSSIRDLDTAYKNFFRGIKTGEDIGLPKFKNKRSYHQSYTSRAPSNIHVYGNTIQLPKLGLVKCRISRQIYGRVLSVTVSQNPSGKYFASICCTDIFVTDIPKTGMSVGIDLGVKDFAIMSDGQKFENYKYLSRSENKIKRLQRQLSRKPKDSNNREKARKKFAALHEHVANQRKDMLHKLSTWLVKSYDIIVVETLNAESMMVNRWISKSIHDVSWYTFVKQLTYKCEQYGKRLIKVDSFYPSSQLCSKCGYKNVDTKRLEVRSWVCPQCSSCHDRDVNAAINILNEGLRLSMA